MRICFVAHAAAHLASFCRVPQSCTRDLSVSRAHSCPDTVFSFCVASRSKTVQPVQPHDRISAPEPDQRNTAEVLASIGLLPRICVGLVTFVLFLIVVGVLQRTFI